VGLTWAATWEPMTCLGTMSAMPVMEVRREPRLTHISPAQILL
jgi:hypothetical protein